MSLFFQWFDSAKTSKKIWKLKKKSQRDQAWGPNGNANLVNKVDVIECSDISKHK